MTIEALRGTNERHYESVLAVSQPVGGAIPLTLYIKVFLNFRRAGTYHFRSVERHPTDPRRVVERTRSMTIEAFEESDRLRLQNDFQEVVDTFWDDHLWLSPPEPDAGISSIKCRVALTFVATAPESHLTVLVLYRPSGEGYRYWRDGALHDPTPGRTDMELAYRQDTGFRDDRNRLRPSSDVRGKTRFSQNILAHEFGHFLGLPHPCHGYPGVGLNSLAEYCVGRTQEQMQDLMAVGSSLRGWHAQPWIDRLHRHQYHNEVFWKGTLDRPARS